MFIRCSDGQFYRDPIWILGDDRVLTSTELSYKLKLTNAPSWSHARRGLGDFEIRPIGSSRREDAIFGDKLSPALIFGIKFIDAPPPPKQHKGWLSDVSGVDDDVIDFQPKATK